MNFDDEEQEILAAFTAGTLKKSGNAKEEIQLAILAAQNTLRQSKKIIPIQLDKSDLDILTVKAAQQGLTREDFIASLLHQYAVKAELPHIR